MNFQWKLHPEELPKRTPQQRADAINALNDARYADRKRKPRKITAEDIEQMDRSIKEAFEDQRRDNTIP